MEDAVKKKNGQRPTEQSAQHESEYFVFFSRMIKALIVL